MALDPVKTRFAASLVLGIAACALSWLYLDYREKEILEQGEMVQIVVAKKFIPTYTRLTQEWFAFRDVPRAYTPRGAVTNPSDILGLITLVPFNFKEPILFNKVTDSGQRLAASVPEGMRAFTLGVDAVTGLSGMLRPGDYVDIFHLVENHSSTLFQAVKVLAVGGVHGAGEEANTAPRTVTLALTPKECSLAMLAQSQGLTQLALRPTGDQKTTSAAGADSGSLKRRIDTGKTSETDNTADNTSDFTIKKK